ncbi:MAG: AI-2E family transporter [Bacteroidota bacterium]
MTRANRPFLKVTLLLATILLFFWLASFFPDLLITVIISVLAAFILRPLVTFFEFRLGMRRSLSIAVVFLLLGGVFAFVVYETIPLLVEGARSMYANVKDFPFDQKLADATKGFASSVPFIDPENLVLKVHALVVQGQNSLGNALTSAASVAVNLAIVPFVTYFILAEGDQGIEFVIQRVPNKYFEMTLNVLGKIRHNLISYLRGWILDSVVVGLLTVAGLFIIGVEYALVIGTLAGIANLVPYVGPIVGACLAILVSLMQYGDFHKVVAILVLTATIRILDDVVVQPFFFAKSIDMHPVFVILLLILGHEMMGIVGMVVAIPLATILRASAAETYWGFKNYQISA